MKISVLGIDLGKNVFHVYGIDEREQLIVRKKLKCHKLQTFLANLESCLVGLEACGGAHHWAGMFQQ